MRQVVSVTEMVEKEQLEKLPVPEYDETAAAAAAIGGPCQCSCSPTNSEITTDQPALREPLSAPF